MRLQNCSFMNPFFLFRSFSAVSSSSNPYKKKLSKVCQAKYKPILLYLDKIGVGRDISHKKRRKIKISQRNNINEFPVISTNRTRQQANKELVTVLKRKSGTQHRTSKSTTRFGEISGRRGKKSILLNIAGNKHRPPPPFCTMDPNSNRRPVRILGSSTIAIHEQGIVVDGKYEKGKDNMHKDVYHIRAGKNNDSDFSLTFPKGSKNIPEVAIIGRSNVGKSTLLNALLYGNQWFDLNGKGRELSESPRLIPSADVNVRSRYNFSTNKLPRGVKATISAKPGETKEITFYQLTSLIEDAKQKEGINLEKSKKKNNKLSLILTDLPGYGFAFSSEKNLQLWLDLILTYLLFRGSSLKRILLLIDARHGLKQTDRDFLTLLQRNHFIQTTSTSKIPDDHLQNRITKSRLHVEKRKYDIPPIQVVLTKCDLMSRVDLARQAILVQEEFAEIFLRQPGTLPLMFVSAKPGLGFNNFRKGKAAGGILELQKELASLIPNYT